MVNSIVNKSNRRFKVAPSKRTKGLKKNDKVPFLVQHPKKRRGVVYINHLPHGFYENQLYAFLSQFGTVTNLRVGRSSKTGNPKGYAFAEFLYPEVADIVASTMNNYLMFKKILKCSVVSKSRLSRRIFKNKIHPNNPPAPKIRAKSKHALNNVNVSDEVVEKRKYKQYGKLIKLQKMLQEAGIETTIKIPKTVLKAKSETETDKTETVKKPKVKTPSQRPLISLVLDDKIKSLKRKRISDQTKGKQNSDSSLSSTSVTPKHNKPVGSNTPQSGPNTPKNLKRPAQASPETPSNMNKKIKNAVDVKQGTTPGKGEALTTTSQTPSHSKNSMDQAEASSSGKVMLKSGSKKRKRQSLSGDSVQVVEGSSKQEDANLSFSSDKKVASKSPKAKKVHKAPPVPQKMSSSPTLQESNQSSSSCPTTPVSSQGGKKNPSTPSTSKKNKTPNSKIASPGAPLTTIKIKTPNSKIASPGTPLTTKKNKNPNSKVASPGTPLTTKMNKTPNSKIASPGTPSTSKNNKTPNSKITTPSTPLSGKKVKMPNAKLASPATTPIAKKVKTPNSKNKSLTPSVKIDSPSTSKKANTPTSKSNLNTPKAKKGGTTPSSTPGSAKKTNVMNKSQITPSLMTPKAKVDSPSTSKKSNTPTSKSNTPKPNKRGTPGSIRK
uniref:RRM domain-containing protein n=1 Tax=Lepeophtheirus salmonis TaxID=72036 RepID=A0A0K2TDX2_LEPSM